ncbi:MAG: magnesium transporter [Clostridia bacterium]|nr:magnesium transporter [Clostridia bacterium]
MTEITSDQILELLDAKKFLTIKEMLSEINPIDIAELFGEIPAERVATLFRLLPKELAADAFVEMDSDLQEKLILGFSDNELRSLVAELYVDDTVDIIEEMPANVVKRIINSADPSMRSDINQILKYPKDSAGSIMTTEYVSLRPGMTVGEAFERIRRVGTDSETIYTCYVTTKDKKLLGVVTVKEMLLSDQDKLVNDLMEENIIFAYTDEDREETANRLRDYGLMALPVVDREQRLVGIVTYDDALVVITEENEEDFSKMAGVMPTETPYIKTSVFALWKARIPWLLLLMISATFTGAIISGFESKLAACLVLSGFIPMLMDTGGNSGSQASVSVIRAISLGDITIKDLLKVLFKEVRVGILCGVVLACCNMVKMFLFDRLIMGNDDVTLTVMITVCTTLAVTVVIAKMVGALLPLLAKAIGLDPAVMAAPVISTLVDAISLLVYFGLASVMVLPYVQVG